MPDMFHQSVVAGTIFYAAVCCGGQCGREGHQEVGQADRMTKLLRCWFGVWASPNTVVGGGCGLSSLTFWTTLCWNIAVAIATCNGIAIKDWTSQAVLHPFGCLTAPWRIGIADPGSDSCFPHLHSPFSILPTVLLDSILLTNGILWTDYFIYLLSTQQTPRVKLLLCDWNGCLLLFAIRILFCSFDTQIFFF